MSFNTQYIHIDDAWYDSVSMIAWKMADNAYWRYHFYILISTIEQFTSELLPLYLFIVP